MPPGIRFPRSEACFRNAAVHTCKIRNQTNPYPRKPLLSQLQTSLKILCSFFAPGCSALTSMQAFPHLPPRLLHRFPYRFRYALHVLSTRLPLDRFFQAALHQTFSPRHFPADHCPSADSPAAPGAGFYSAPATVLSPCAARNCGHRAKIPAGGILPDMDRVCAA